MVESFRLTVDEKGLLSADDYRKYYDEYLAHTAAVESANPNLCVVTLRFYGGYSTWLCTKHGEDADHRTITGRLVCDVYAASEPGCDPLECCAQLLED